MKVRLLISLNTNERIQLADARNIMFNWMLAHHHHGHIFLRLDDLDDPGDGQSAEDDPSERGREHLELLDWLGLTWEGDPNAPTDEHKPLRLSERLPLYRSYADRLLESGLAYRCFCSRETLSEMMRKQRIHGRTPHYDGRCLRLSPAEVHARLEAGDNYRIRLKTPEVVSEVNDLIRGRLVFDPRSVADLVIMRLDGRPTPALANVVDDKELGITYSMRGDRLKDETTREAFLFHALGLEAPTYIHIPLLLGSDRRLLSARHGDLYLDECRKHGYLPDGLINYLAQHGIPPSSDEQLRTLGALTRAFKVEKINQSPTVWQEEKLKLFNRLAIEKLSDEQLARMLVPYVEEAGYDLLAQGDEWVREFVTAVRPGLNKLADVQDFVDIFLADGFEPDKKAQELLKQPEARLVHEAILDRVEAMDAVDLSNYREILDEARDRTRARGKALTFVRLVLTGRQVGPEFSKLLPLLGKERILARLNHARRYIPRAGRGGPRQ